MMVSLSVNLELRLCHFEPLPSEVVGEPIPSLYGHFLQRPMNPQLVSDP